MRRRRLLTAPRGALLLTASALALAWSTAVVHAQALPQTHVLIVTGASGEPRFADAFHREATALRNAAIQRFGIPDSLVTWLAEDPARDRAISGRSDRDGVTAAIERIAARASAGDQVFILLLGHGSADNQTARFNVPGRDLTDEDFAALLDKLSRQKVAFVNAASASGDFIKRLSGPNRIIITATKSGFERNETLFGEHFVQALTGDGADVDKDGRVSLLEAFTYARREVARAYESTNRLQTEHAMLDDDGNGTGSDAPSADAADGQIARAFYLAPAAGAAAALANDPRAQALIATQRRLEAQIDSLRVVKASMPDSVYQKQLEDLLVKLAETTQALRALQVRKP
ncbi:MAG TPA: C13 family peptidase [Gemmatimonadaceae bacterium]